MPERRKAIFYLNSGELRSSVVSAEVFPARAYRKPIYALAPEFDWVALVIQKLSLPVVIALRISFTETLPDVKLRSSATDFLIPNTTGKEEIDLSA